VGSSLVEDDKVDLAKELLQSAGDKIILPTDVIIADKFAEDAKTDTVQTGDVPDGWMGLDIGPDSVKLIQDTLADAQTVLWNGPAGVFEMEAFSKGTFAIAQTLADITKKGAITIVGGGDSVAAVEQANLGDQISHISTGGGASLELIEGKTLPGVAALDNQKVHA
jgi:phosphoglycerate kinase